MLRTKCSIDDLQRIISCLDSSDWLLTLLKHKSIIESESNISKLTELLFMAITRFCERRHSQRQSQGFLSTNDDYKTHLLNDINTLYDIYGNRLQQMVKDYDAFVNFVNKAKKATTGLHFINSDWIISNLLKRINIIHTPNHLADLLNRVQSESRPTIIDIVHAHWEIEYRKTCRMTFLLGSKDPGSSHFKLFHNQYGLMGNNRNIDVNIITKIFDHANLGKYTNTEVGVDEKGYSLKL